MERLDPMNFLIFVCLFLETGRWTLDKQSKADGKLLLACTKLAVALSTGYRKDKEQNVLGAIFNGHFHQIRPSLAQCWPGLRFIIICPRWESSCLHFRSISFWKYVTVPSLLHGNKWSWISVLNAFSVWPLLSDFWTLKLKKKDNTPLGQVPKTITSSSPPGLSPAFCSCFHQFWVGRQRGWRWWQLNAISLEATPSQVFCLCETWLFHNLCLRLVWLKATIQTWEQAAAPSVVQVLFWLVWVPLHPNHLHFIWNHSSKGQPQTVIYWDLDSKDIISTCEIPRFPYI